MPRLFLTLLCTACMAGLALAAEVTLVKYDKNKKELTVMEGDKEATYKLTDKTKYTFTNQEGKETAGDFAAAEKMLTFEKAAGRMKLDVTTEKEVVTAVKFKGRNKKKPG